MNKALLDVIFASGKRKNMLLMLNDGPAEISSLLSNLETSRQALLPQAKILEDNYLIVKNADSYELTNIGKIIVDKMEPLLGTMDTLDNDMDYWGTHDLGFLPPSLLERIRDLQNCSIATPSMTDMFKLNSIQMDRSFASKSIFMISTLMHPEGKDLVSNLLNNGVNISMIISEDLFQKMKMNEHDAFKCFLNESNIRFFVYSKPIGFINFSVNDYSVFFRLLTKFGEHDGKHLIADGQDAVDWGRELFEFYKQDSTEITEI
ncbi:winged helix-turn-helix domain-containing protein [Methanolobus sp. ZRKC2]|uniref:helix-turn-helix transcriptional regulator n=1 Tax=Methanolobus sp. ZRKC2 TaxID=3125783 RepID=UPI0032493BA6